jgi:hypothetical protein
MHTYRGLEFLSLADDESMAQQKGVITNLCTFHCATFVNDDELATVEGTHSAVCSHSSLVLNSSIYHKSFSIS